MVEYFKLFQRNIMWLINHTVVIILILFITAIIFYFLFNRFILGWTSWSEWIGLEWLSLDVVTKINISSNGTIVKEITPGKIFWDIYALFLSALGASFLAYLNNKNQTKRIHIEREIAADQQRENILRTYFDDMSKLILDKKLVKEKGKKYSLIINIAQVKTITALRSLDTKRRDYILQFLRDAKLKDFLLEGASLMELDLNNNRLVDINLRKSNLRNSNLYMADLFGGSLAGAILNDADLSYAKLFNADFSEAYLWETNLHNALLSGANLQGAFLYKANLSGANLINATLTNADLSNAILTNADLTGANLTGALVSQEQLTQAKLLKGTTLPNSSILS